MANSEGKRYPAETIYDLICGLRRHLRDAVGSEALNPLLLNVCFCYFHFMVCMNLDIQ